MRARHLVKRRTRVETLGGHAILTPGVDEATGKDDMTVNVTATGISSRQSGFGCGNEEHIEGEYGNLVTVRGVSDDVFEDPHDVWISEGV